MSGSIVKDGATMDFGAGGRVHDIPHAFGCHSFDRGRARGRQSLGATAWNRKLGSGSEKLWRRK